MDWCMVQEERGIESRRCIWHSVLDQELTLLAQMGLVILMSFLIATFAHGMPHDFTGSQVRLYVCVCTIMRFIPISYACAQTRVFLFNFIVLFFSLLVEC